MPDRAFPVHAGRMEGCTSSLGLWKSHRAAMVLDLVEIGDSLRNIEK